MTTTMAPAYAGLLCLLLSMVLSLALLFLPMNSSLMKLGCVSLGEQSEKKTNDANQWINVEDKQRHAFDQLDRGEFLAA
jgi:hypothetical protein